MSVHVAVVVDEKQLSDQETSVCFRCCGDPKTDSYHTIKVLKETTSAEVQAWTDERQQHVQDCHAAMANAKAIFAARKAAALAAPTPNITPGS